jgi:hypothetical protein
MSILFLDTETSGLPPMKCRDYLNPKKYKLYCRLTELNWVIMDKNREKILKRKNNIDPIKDIDNIKLNQILQQLYNDLKEYKIKKIVGYNILFHYHVIISEAYRIKNGKLIGKLDFINYQPKIKPICVMKMAMVYIGIDELKYPKLDELYYLFFKKEIKGKKLVKCVKCFYHCKDIKNNKTLTQKYNNKYNKYLYKLKK